MMKQALIVAAATLLISGCAASVPPTTMPEPTPAQREAKILSAVTQLTFSRDFERAGEAYFSADGRWVVFQAVPKGEKNYQMYVARLVRVRGEPAGLVVATRVSPPGSRNTCGWFSDDGRALLFASTAGKDDPEEASPGYQRQGSRYRWAFSKGMEIYRVDDWERRVMTSSPGGYVNLATPDRRITENVFYDAECVLSPDGRWVVFCSDRHSVTGPGSTPSVSAPPAAPAATQQALQPRQLWAMPSDGRGPAIQLTATQGYNGGPFFSPDGKRIVFRADRNGNDLLQVFVADIVRGRHGEITGLSNERQLTDDANVNWGPYWHPDGRHIFYATSKLSHSNYEIFLRRDDGSRETRVTFSPGPDVLPVVSPDGKYLMWSSRRGEDNTTQIYIARLTVPKGS